jgi:uncharacterized protein YlzI (FlbEa/FlbD family)
MFIKVKNAAEGRKGDPLLINVNHILSIYENHPDGGSLSTVIYSFNGLNWIVEESFTEISNKIEDALDKKSCSC